MAALRGTGLRALLAAMLGRQHLAELLDSLGGERAGSAAGTEARAVLDALRRWPTSCLYRALAGYAVLRSNGEQVRFVIGVRPERGELLAHAWLERDGLAIGEATDPRDRYAVAFVHPGAAAPQARTKDVEIRMNQLAPSPDVLLTELKDGTGVLLHLRTKFYYALNRTGVSVWKLVADGRAATAEALAAEIASRFRDTPLAQARRDVEALLRELEEEGLLVRREAAPPSDG